MLVQDISTAKTARTLWTLESGVIYEVERLVVRCKLQYSSGIGWQGRRNGTKVENRLESNIPK